jgi:two-component system chemotaxis sensor kinase CheA
MDLSDVQDVFFEECLEGLDVMETGMLRLDESTDIEDLNAIFRAAHSIKGGAGTFGFPDISAFTHVMETLLDEMRDGRRDIEKSSVDLLLESVDVLRGMVDAAQNGGENDEARIKDVQGRLETLLAGGAAAAPAAEVGEAPAAEAGEAPAAEAGEAPAAEAEAPAAKPAEDDTSGVAGWKILFAPGPEMLVRGNEPLRIFRELGKLGDMSVTADVSDLPRLGDLNPRVCSIRWTITLASEASEAQVKEVFAWVEDECTLELGKIGGGSKPVAAAKPAAAEAAAPAAAPKPSRKAAPAAPGKAPAQAAKAKDGGSIRVGIEKVDELINLVGELVITQSMLTQVTEQFDSPEGGSVDHLRDGITQLERNTRELQQSVLKIRMLPITVSFSRFPRLVRDLSSKLGKNIELRMTGEQTEVDKTVLEKINDPLVHLVRNSLDHGIEMPADRVAAGKPEKGTLTLAAFHEGGDIVIKVIDDGGGLKKDRILSKAIERGIVKENEELSDERIYNLIFAPGFSTADTVSDVSGRGVGMDVVRRNIRDLGGNVTITSEEGQGSEVTIRLPLTLAILDGQLASLRDQTYVLPLVSIIESLMITRESLEAVTEEAELYRLRDEYIPIIRLDKLFGMPSSRSDLVGGLLVVVESDGRRVGLLVDELLGQQQVVIKSLETNFRQIEGISGATILGDGTIALIIDVPGLIMGYFESLKAQESKRAEVMKKVMQPTEAE